MMLKINNALVLMIDFQDKLVGATSAQKELEEAKKLILASSILELPTIVTEQYPKGLGETVEQLKKEFKDNIEIFEKTAFSAYFEDEIKEKIQKLNKKQVILFGIEAHVCVYQTALDLIENGYEVYLVKNASKSRDENNANLAFDLLRTQGVKIVSTEIVLFELLKTSKHPKFKEIQALIK